MKKLILAIFSIALMALPATLAGCGDDNGGDEPQAPAKLEADLGFKLTVPVAVAKYFNITVDYTDSHGSTATHQMPEADKKGYCSLEVIEPVSRFPAEVKIVYHIAASGVKPDVDRIDTYSGLETYAGVYDEKGLCVSGKLMQAAFGSDALDTKQLNSYIQTFEAACKTTVIKVSADGKVSVQQ